VYFDIWARSGHAATPIVKIIAIFDKI